MDARRKALVRKASISVYVTESEKQRIENAALECEKRASEFLRNLGLSKAAELEQPKRGRPRKVGSK